MIKIINDTESEVFLTQNDLRDGHAYLAWYENKKLESIFVCNRYNSALAYSLDGCTVIGQEFRASYKFKEVNLEVRIVE